VKCPIHEPGDVLCHYPTSVEPIAPSLPLDAGLVAQLIDLKWELAYTFVLLGAVVWAIVN
jgi:hypothetical protein